MKVTIQGPNVGCAKWAMKLGGIKGLRIISIIPLEEHNGAKLHHSK